MLDELPGSGSDAVIGLPPEECVTLAAQLPTADQSLFADMAFAQLEMKGLGHAGPDATVFAYHVLEREPGRSLLSVDVLPQDFNEDLCINKAQAYTAATRLFPIHDHAVVILKQHDRLVLAAGKHGRMTFTQILNCGTEFNDAFIQEVNLTILSLQGAGQLPERVTLELWTEVPPEDRDKLESRFAMPVDFTRRPDPDPRLAKDASSPMLPNPVLAFLAKQRRAATIRLCVLVGLLVYAMIAVAVLFTTQKLKARTAQLEAQVANDRSAVVMVKTSKARAEMFQPAFDKRLFSMIQLAEINRIMPSQGLVMREFKIEDLTVRIEGVANTAEIVDDFVEDLNENPNFPGYTWEMPRPPTLQEDTARFLIVGNYAPAD